MVKWCTVTMRIIIKQYIKKTVGLGWMHDDDNDDDKDNDDDNGSDDSGDDNGGGGSGYDDGGGSDVVDRTIRRQRT